MKKYIFRSIGYMPHVCASCQDVKRFSTHRVFVEKRKWSMKTIRMPYGYLIQCAECGYRTLYDRSLLDDSVEKFDDEQDIYSSLVKIHGEEHYFVHIANAYRNVAAGLASENTSWALLVYAMEGAHFETRAPRDGQWIRTTTLNRVSKSLIGFLCILIGMSLVYAASSSVLALPDDGIFTVILFFVFLFAVFTWAALSVVAFVRESRSKIQEVRDRRALLGRFAHFLRGIEVDGQMLESVFKKGRDQGVVTASLDPFVVLETCAKVNGQDNPAMNDWSHD